MKVLHLPINVATQVSTAVRSLRAIGVETRGVVSVLMGDVIQTHDGLELLPDSPEKKAFMSLGAAATQAYRYAKILGAVHWADVIHWHFGEVALRDGLDLRWARFLGKPGVAEFWGSDIRIAALEAADNPYFARYAPRDYQDALPYERSRKIQSMFSEAGFDCLVSSNAMRAYVQHDLFPKVHLVRQRILLSDYTPRFPDPHRKRPLIVHSPSNPLLKGTPMVLAAIEHLRTKVDFEFSLIHKMPHSETIHRVSEADIFVDQFIYGEHGMATMEAMAMGKPAVCYIKPSMTTWYPPDSPIVNASPDNLAEVLEGLIKDGKLRHELGIRGRAYVQKYHDALKLAHQLKAIYEELLDRRRGA